MRKTFDTPHKHYKCTLCNADIWVSATNTSESIRCPRKRAGKKCNGALKRIK